MNVLIKNIDRIWAISIDENVDVGVARDVFIRFLDCGVPSGAEWHNMTSGERTEVIKEYEAFEHTHYEAICKAYSEGGREAVKAFVASLFEA